VYLIRGYEGELSVSTSNLLGVFEGGGLGEKGCSLPILIYK
jgi:hypothetical protein|tara:strand:- start:1509 stop:1631 length:123 start_codon:yes stop_codon:yes gene_type:complete